MEFSPSHHFPAAIYYSKIENENNVETTYYWCLSIIRWHSVQPQINIQRQWRHVGAKEARRCDVEENVLRTDRIVGLKRSLEAHFVTRAEERWRVEIVGQWRKQTATGRDKRRRQRQ